MTSPARRKPKTETTSDPGAGGLRDMIRQAISAYELAIATQARTEAQADRRRQQRLAELAADERAAAAQREQRQQDQQSMAIAEAERTRALATLADDLTECASGLLERAALAYVRGFGPGSAEVKPHVADDEQVAAAFTAAQMASVDLRAALLRLAGEHLRGRDWPRARQVLAPLLTGPPGELLDAATATFRTACLEEATGTLDHGDPGQARAQAQAWLDSHPDDADFAALLTAATDAIREAALRQAREDLASGAAERARAQAAAWLQTHEHDEDFKGLLVETTITLAEQAMAAGDHTQAAGEIAAAVPQAGAGHPGLQRVMRSHPAIAWRTGQVRLLREFGGHRQPVRDVVFTPDGSRLVSVDGTEVKTWEIMAADRGALVRTVPLLGACGLTPNGALALSKNGELIRTDDGAVTAQVGAIASHAFSRDGTLLAHAVRNQRYRVIVDPTGRWQIEQSVKGLLTNQELNDPEQQLLTSGQVHLYTFHSSRDYLSATSPKTEGGIGSWAAIAGGFGRRAATANFIRSLSMTDTTAGRKLGNVVMDHAHLFVDIAISSNARLVAVRTYTGEVILTDIDSKKRIHSFRSPSAQSLLNALVFSPTGDRILVVDVSPPIYQGDNSHPYIHALGDPPVGLIDLRPHPGSKNEHTEMSMWDIATGSLAGSLAIKARYGAVTFSPDGRLIAALATDGHISLLDADTLDPLPPIGAHKPMVPPCLAFSPDGSLLATGGDHSVKVWGL